MLQLLLFWFLFIIITFINQTFVKSTSFFTVLFPITHSNPAKLILTLWTCHMISTLIFLNWLFTFRSTFCISNYPFSIFFITRIFNRPPAHHFSIQWFMPNQTSTKSKFITTITWYTYFCQGWVSDISFSFFLWTPFNLFTLISEWSSYEKFIFLILFFC